MWVDANVFFPKWSSLNGKSTGWITRLFEPPTARIQRDRATQTQVLHPRHVPYPSGQGLHVGHPEGYTATDILARFKRMNGFHVLHPMGWDAFGLPAEQYAVQTNTHPSITTARNIDNFRGKSRCSASVTTGIARLTPRSQLLPLDAVDLPQALRHLVRRRPRQKADRLPTSPSPREIAVQGEDAVAEYRNEHRLAYLSKIPVNWCEALGTVLATKKSSMAKVSAATTRWSASRSPVDASHHRVWRPPFV